MGKLLKKENIELGEELCENAIVPVTAVTEKGKKGKNKQKSEDVVDVDRFSDLSLLVGVAKAELEDEFFAFHIKKILSNVRKVIVREEITDAQLEKAFLLANDLFLGGLTVAPIHLSSMAKFSKRHNISQMKVGTLVDFPFGESSLKSKLADVKAGIITGADDVSVTLPNVMLLTENEKMLKKQIKKLGKIYRDSIGITVNASDLAIDKLKKVVTFFKKSKLVSITFAFGGASFNEVKEKLAVIKDFDKKGKTICVLADVDSIEGVREVRKLGVDLVLTPHADQVGKDLVKRFKLKSEKLK